MKLLLAFDNDEGGTWATFRAIKMILNFNKTFKKTDDMDMRLRLGLPISTSLNEKVGDKELEMFNVKQLSKPERERIFLEDGVSLGEAHEAKRLYLEDELKETAKRYFEIQEHNQKYPEFPLDLPNLKKAQNDYDWHLKLNKNNKTLNIEWVKENRKVGEFVQINRGFASCPLHKERTPSFNVSKDEKLWFCFGCSEGGSVIDLVMKLQGLNFVEAVKYLS